MNLSRLQRLAKPALPERSLALRRWVFVASLPPLLAVAWAGWLWGPALLAFVILAAGHYYSWRAAQHARPNPFVQLIVFVALHLALAWMCAGIYIGAALPQAQFALYAQAVTSFDLRRRLNLFSSLGMGLLVLYVAATLSRDYSFAVFLLAFVVLSLGVFFRVQIEDGLQGARLRLAEANGAQSGHAKRVKQHVLWFALLTPFLLLASCLVFAFSPHFASRPLIPPFSLNLPIPRGATSQILNPALPLVQINGWSSQKGDYYYGFDSQLDLRYRGGLSDQVVMYVLSPAWSYWRSHSYDYYNGHAWSMSQATVSKIKRESALHFDVPADAQALGDEIVQSYYMVRDQPNLIFAAYRPMEIYINSEEMAIDAGEGLRVGEPLKAGTMYTVLSRRPNFSAEALRAATGGYPAEIAGRYLQLPDNISSRVRDLARQVTANVSTPYDKAVALRDYLRGIKYDPFPPPQPPGSETVDNFLFVDRRGVCEQFATAHVVLLRELGIPARLVAGYGSGEHNPLSGYYAVRASDAHAWTEVYFPGYGWVPFDPTPGWTPSPYTASVQRWIFSATLDGLPSVPLGQMLSAGAALIGATFGSMTAVMILIVMAALALIVFQWRRAQRSRLAQPTVIDRDPNRLRILAAYRAGQRRLGLYRAMAETPREFSHRVARDDWGELTAIVQNAAYRTAAPSPMSARRAWELVHKLPRHLIDPRTATEQLVRSYAQKGRAIRLRVAPQAVRLLKIERPTPRTEITTNQTPTGRGCILYATIGAGILGAMISTGLVFLLGGTGALIENLIGPVPAVALVMAAGGGLIAWAGVRFARDRWMVWVFMGSLGMTVLTVIASFAAQIAAITVALVIPSLRWWQTRAEIIPGMIEGVTWLMPLTVPLGFLLGFTFFGVAGWLWGRRLAKPLSDTAH